MSEPGQSNEPRRGQSAIPYITRTDKQICPSRFSIDFEARGGSMGCAVRLPRGLAGRAHGLCFFIDGGLGSPRSGLGKNLPVAVVADHDHRSPGVSDIKIAGLSPHRQCRRGPGAARIPKRHLWRLEIGPDLHRLFPVIPFSGSRAQGAVRYSKWLTDSRQAKRLAFVRQSTSSRRIGE